MHFFSRLCTPAKVYFGIACLRALYSIVMQGRDIMHSLLRLFFAFLWSFLIGWICRKGHASISWAIVLLPYLLTGLVAMRVYNMSFQHRELLNRIHMQGTFGEEF